MTRNNENKYAGRIAILLGVACFSGFFAGAVPALADYPDRPITMVVPFAAGGGTDTIARIVVEHMAKTLGQPIIIENAPGAGGTTASSRIRKPPLKAT